jgi:acetyl esterase/lipase
MNGWNKNKSWENHVAMFSLKRIQSLVAVAFLLLVPNFADRGFGHPTPPQQGNSQQPAPQSAPAMEGVQIDRNNVFGMYGGLALLMDVYRPAKPNGFGAIYIEGSGWTIPSGYGAPALKNYARGVSPYVRIMVQAGYTVFSIDHRAAPIFHYPAQIEDAQRAVRYIRFHAKDYAIDPTHIGAVGYSSGAHIASLLGLFDGAGNPADRDPVNHESARVQCVIAGGIPAVLVPAADYANPAGFNLLSGLIGETVQQPITPGSSVYQKLMDASPIQYVKAGGAPFLLIHGDADELVPYADAEAMRILFEKNDVPAKVITVKGGTHTSTVMDHNAEYAPEIVRWLDKYLRGIASGQ